MSIDPDAKGQSCRVLSSGANPTDTVTTKAWLVTLQEAAVGRRQCHAWRRGDPSGDSPDRLGDLADLFQTGPATRGCWCMWFINPSEEVRKGWRDGGNRRAFESLADRADPPLGLIAYDGDVPIGWVATGPRSRYPRAIGPRVKILKDGDPEEDDDVWLLPCFFVRVGYRRRGVTPRSSLPR